MTTLGRDRTPGVLTTQKLQAMIDTGLRGNIRSRRALATALTDSGEKISVHGVEGWFKNVDSNYAIERESLDPEQKSYAIPRRRWAAILTLFDVDAEQIRQSDRDFRSHCFRVLKKQKTSAPSTGPRPELPLIYVLYAQEDSARLEEEFRWLREAGFSLWLDNSVREASPWAAGVSASIERATVGLVYLSPAFAQSERCIRELTLACEHGLEIVVSSTSADGGLERHPLLEDVSFACVVKRSPSYRSDLRESLKKALDGRPVAPAKQVFDTGSAMNCRVAVLPFANLSGQQDISHVTQGLTEDINTLLARVTGLQVVSRVASFGYSGILADFQQLRVALGVDFVVEGSVRPGPAGLRVNVSLTNVETGVTLWGDQLNGDFDELYAAQDEIVAAVVQELGVTPSGNGLNYGARAAHATTWRYCNLGWFKSFVEPHMPALREALECFQAALDVEPDYAPAHAGIANALGTGMIWGGIGQDQYATLEKHALRAYEIAPEHPAALYAMGMRKFVTADPMDETLSWVDKAVQREPSNPAYLAAKAYLLAHTCRVHEGLAVAGIVRSVSAGDLRQPFINYMISNVHICAEEFDAGVSLMRESDGLQNVDFVWFMLGYCYYCLENEPEAITALERFVTMSRRSLNFFTFSIMHRLWPQHDESRKRAFLQLCRDSGLE